MRPSQNENFFVLFDEVLHHKTNLQKQHGQNFTNPICEIQKRDCDYYIHRTRLNLEWRCIELELIPKKTTRIGIYSECKYSRMVIEADCKISQTGKMSKSGTLGKEKLQNGNLSEW